MIKNCIIHLQAETAPKLIDNAIAIGSHADKLLNAGKHCSSAEVEGYARALQMFLETLATHGRNVAQCHAMITEGEQGLVEALDPSSDFQSAFEPICEGEDIELYFRNAVAVIYKQVQNQVFDFMETLHGICDASDIDLPESVDANVYEIVGNFCDDLNARLDLIDWTYPSDPVGDSSSKR